MYKKMMKRATAFVVALSMMLSMAACGKKTEKETTTESTTESTTEGTTEVEATETDTDEEPVINMGDDTCPYTMPDPDSAEAKEEQEKFDDYLWDTFEESVTDDTLTLHYTVADPESYGLTPPEATFGEEPITDETIAEDKEETEEEIDELEAFDYELLTGEQKYTYDVMMNYLETDLMSYDYAYYYEPFAYTSGLQSNMPINMSEYKFYRESDVTDYLSLLNEFPGMFEIYLDFEELKAKKGYFMNEHSASEVIRQCKDFIADPENNLLIATFEDKVRGVEGLSEEQIQDYITQNHDAVINSVIPAYQETIKFFQKHLRAGTNDLGLSHYEGGKEYYKYMLAKQVGTDKTPEEVIACLEEALEESMSELESLAFSNYEDYMSYFEASEAGLYEGHEPLDTINFFKEEFADSFPEMPDVDYNVQNVHESMEDSVSPAFYVTTPIDSYFDNYIYLNMGSSGAGDLWSTLAHEGIPGHLYQFTYYLNTKPEPIRALLNFNGYQEGWATYVEMMSYDKFDGYEKEVYRDFERINGRLNLLVSARVEIGVNYEGWDLEDTKDYLVKSGFNGEAAKDIMDYVIAEPANYQMYVMGWLTFEELRDKAKTALGDRFDEKEFHKVLLDAGPSQFFLVEKLVDQYIRDNQ